MTPPQDPPHLRMLSPEPEAPPAPPASPQRGKTLPLARVKGGQDFRITSIQLGPKKRDQLHEQGILSGSKARILHNDHKGRVILRVGNELFILGRLETARMFVVVL